MCKDLTYSYKLSYKQKLQLDKIVKNVNKLPQKEKSYYKIQSLKKMANFPKDTLQYDILKMIYQNIDFFKMIMSLDLKVLLICMGFTMSFGIFFLIFMQRQVLIH